MEAYADRKQNCMRCIYIVPNSPISPNYRGGGAAVFYEQLISLSELGIEVYLWHFTYQRNELEFETFVREDAETWKQIQALCSKVYRSTIPEKPSLFDRAANRLSSFVSGNEILNPPLRRKCFPILKALIKDIGPDFIWAQHLAAAQIALLQEQIPVVFSHHDWLHKIKFIENDHPSKFKLKCIEEFTAGKAAAVVSGSAVECEELRSLGCQNVHYLPLAYEPVAVAKRETDQPRVVHLGGLATTANRIGLERFFEVVFDKLSLSRDQMWLIGDMRLASDKLKLRFNDVTTTGFIRTLDTAMRPNDIHVIPWEEATGQRTRLICAFNYGQAVVATRKAVSCFPEVIDESNALLVDSLEEMPKAIERLLSDTELRLRLATNARRTFERHFTRRELLPKYQKVVDSLILERSNQDAQEHRKC